MTGFFFLLNKNKAERIPLEIKQMADLISHRGDSEVQSISNKKYFLKNFTNKAQLSNMDNAFFNNDEFSYTIKNFAIIDGFIKNKKEIHELLNNDEINFDNVPLNKCIFEGYKRFGFKFFEKLNGAYSLILGNDQEIVAVKDPIGNKPLYILENDKYLIFSSELKSLKNLGGTPVYWHNFLIKF